jgi:hypothetical protein
VKILPGFLVGCFVSLLAAHAFAAPIRPNVLTSHNDNFRTGQNTNEYILNPANVNSANFSKLFTYPVDGFVFAQPLYVSGLSIAGQGIHNVLFVATEHNSVYALEADSNKWFTNGLIWKVNLGSAAITPTNSFGNRYNGGLYTDITNEVGITGTPVIDLQRGTIFVDAFTREASGFVHRIHALNLTNGTEQPNSPVAVVATYPGTGAGSSGGVLTFSAQQQIQRSALTLAGDTLYLAYSGYADTDPYHGWVLGYNPTTLQLKPGYVWVTTPNSDTAHFGVNAGEAGVWMGGGGLCVDANTNLYFETGNGSFTATNGSGGTEYGDSFVRLSTTNGLKVADYFTPWNQNAMGGPGADGDLGSGACMLVPDQAGTNLHLIVGGGKYGIFYVLNRDQMTTNNTHYNATVSTDPILQGFSFTTNSTVTRFMTGPAYFNGAVYFTSWNDKIKRYPIVNGVLSRTPTAGPRTFAFPACTPVVSGNFTNNGIVWSMAWVTYNTPSVLVAYNATNVATEIYNTTQAAGNRDILTNGVKFATPMVANGKVYAGATYAVHVFGLTDPTLAWKTFHFGVNATNAAISGDFVDAEGDGVVNLMEYAIATDPTSDSVGPVLKTTVTSGRAKVSFTRNAAASDLTYVVETSASLKSPSWSPALTWTSAGGWVPSAAQSVTELPPTALPPDQAVQVNADLGPTSAGQLFVRLRVHR